MDIEKSVEHLKAYDPEVGEAIGLELMRQRRNIELIASENIVSPEVLAAAGSVLTNKYAEGYSGKRYYGGCEYVDIAENICIDRAKRLFRCEYANVQPHSGSQANYAVYMALCKPGDTVLGMNLDNGGHLTHGCKANFSGKNYNAISYGCDPETGLIDYDEVRRLAEPGVRGAGGGGHDGQNVVAQPPALLHDLQQRGKGTEGAAEGEPQPDLRHTRSPFRR